MWSMKKLQMSISEVVELMKILFNSKPTTGSSMLKLGSPQPPWCHGYNTCTGLVWHFTPVCRTGVPANLQSCVFLLAEGLLPRATICPRFLPCLICHLCLVHPILYPSTIPFQFAVLPVVCHKYDSSLGGFLLSILHLFPIPARLAVQSRHQTTGQAYLFKFFLF